MESPIKRRPAKPKPIFQTSLGKLYEGDCLKLFERLNSDSVDLVFADPPFNLGKEYSSGIDDDIAPDAYVAWCLKWITEAIRVLKPGGSFFLYNLPKWNLLLGAHIAQSLTFRNWITVDMKFSLPIKGRLYPANYSLLYFTKGARPRTFTPDRLPIKTCRHCGGEIQDYGGYRNKLHAMGLNLSDVWTDIPPVRHRKYKDRTANQLSLKLLDRIICMASKKGDVVLDPFGGSGTTYIAAELLKRRWIGFELHAKDTVRRLGDLAPDQDHITEIHSEKNTLFTERALKLRAQHGHSNRNYDGCIRKTKSRSPGSAHSHHRG